MRIQHNIMAMNSYRNLGMNNRALSGNLEKLSSGYKINRAGDDAAGLAISEKMRAQITGLDAAQKNVNDGISLVKTAEGAMQEIQDMLNRMEYLATQSANGTYDNDVDRANLQKEVEALKSEIDRIADSSNFNGTKLLDGSLGGGAVSADGATFQGAEVAKYQEASFDITLGDFTGATGTADTNIDTFRIDGQNLTIDWSKGDAAKVLASMNAADLTGSGEEATKDYAQKLEDLFNNEMKAQGLSGSVEVNFKANGTVTIESTNKTAKSEVSYVGSKADADASLGALMFGSTDGKSIVNEATKNYNGDTLAATDYFSMKLNGVTLNVTVGAALTKGTSTMDEVATALQTAIQGAVADYNTELGGLTGGTKDTESGLTGLTASDFVVVEENGSLKITYEGDEDVSFSFSDVGDRTTAAALGLASGSSKSGGATGLTLQIGDTADSYNQISVSVQDMHVNSLGISALSIADQAGAQEAIAAIKDAINTVSSTRGDLGAIQNRLEHTNNNLAVMEENIQDAESTIRDTDIADEMMAYTKNNILIQSAQAMLAQANQVPQGVLQLMQ